MQNNISGRADVTAERQTWRQMLLAAALLAAIVTGALVVSRRSAGANAIPLIPDQAATLPQPQQPQSFKPTPTQWAGLRIEPVGLRQFRSEVVTDGKIGIDEDAATPVFTPYAGQVRKLAVQQGEQVTAGQLLFTIEATDMIQAQNDFITASAALATAQSQLRLAQVTEQRQKELFRASAGSLKDWQQAQADLTAAKNSLRSAEISLEAGRNRLRILKKTDAEIDTFQKTGRINPETPIYAPIGGTVVQRKVGPGQYISNASTDPVFVIGDLSKVWLIANVPEATALSVKSGQDVEFQVLAETDRTFKGKLNFISAVIDAGTRRLMARASIDNPDNLLKPEMFARVTVITSGEGSAPAVPASSIIYEGEDAHVWVADGDKALTYRAIETGISTGKYVEVRQGLKPGEDVVVKGALFIDRAAS